MLTPYFHTDYPCSIAAAQLRRLGPARQPDGTPDPADAITSETTRGVTGQGHLAGQTSST